MKGFRTGRFQPWAAFLLCVFGALCLLPTGMARAQSPSQIVRVGWYESPYNTIDKQGRRSGYAYEYQLKIAAYTGWTYEYVSGSWPELMQMLVDGDIDLMSDVSYTQERSEQMLFTDYPMGAEEYYLFVAPGNQQISSSDPSTLNGKRVGVNKGSIQANYYRDWAKRNGIRAELVELTTPENESLAMLESGELDAYVTVDAFTDPECALPVFKVGSSDFFFTVARERQDLLGDLNSALGRIQSENRFYNQQLFERYIKTAGANAFLSPEEQKWLSGHGAIRVGYVDNYLAFCATDKATGELTGVMKDYLSYAGDCLKNAHLEFEPVGYPTVEAALEDLKQGDIDCVFPANFSGFDGERQGFVMSPPLMSTDVYALVRQADVNNFTNREHVVVAVNEGNPNYESFLLDHYPGWRTVYFQSTEDCLKAVADRVADCVLVSSYRYNNISRLCEKHRLTTVRTAVELDYCFASAKGNTELFSILAKVVCQVPGSTVTSALPYYIAEDAKLDLFELLSDHMVLVLTLSAALMLIILFLMLRSRSAEKKAKQLIAVTERDTLTGLYNREYFFQYANRMHEEQPDKPMDAMVLDIGQFHSLNELNGWDFGDQVLRVLGNELQSIAGELEGIAGRFAADSFDLYCRHTGDYPAILERLQSKVEAIVPNANIRIRMGVMPWQPQMETVQMLDRARTACAMAKGNYASHLVVYDETMQQRELREQRLLNDLRRALDCYEFEVYYQPKYDIQSEPPALVGAEALIRWNHPELGLIPPNDFIPLFERNGRIGEVDQYVLAQAARQIASWRSQFGATVPVSVNLSRVDVFDPTLESHLDDALRQNGLDHSALKLEVTESAYMDNAEQLVRVVERLRGKGYIVEMDDFGTGYSSLNMLSSMPIDVLKMDRTFIENMGNSHRDEQLVGLILGIAANLKVPVIAEGVETQSQLRQLRQLGCTLVQGYYFSPPLHPSDFESRLLRTSEAGT